MKKLLLTTAALTTVSGAAFAAEVYDDTSGLYIGGFGGYSTVDADTSTAGIDFDAQGADYGIFLGYRMDSMMRDMGLSGAIEAHYAWSNVDDTDGGASFEKDNEWGVSFRPGLTMLDSVNPFKVTPYAILGYRRAEFDTSGAGFSGDDDFDGFELGIGTELVAYGNYGVRLDYSHVWYGEENGIDPDEDDLRLGVSYHF